MRKLAATFALLVILGSVAYAGSPRPKECNRPERASDAWSDPIPAAGISSCDDYMPCGMYAQADDDGDPAPPPGMMGMRRMHRGDMEHGRRRIEKFRTIRLLELLNLDSTKEESFLEAYHAYRQDYRTVKGHRMMVIDSLADGLRSGSLNDTQIAQLMTLADSLDDQAAGITDKFYAQVRPMLTEEQLGKLYVFQVRFEAEVLERIAGFRRSHQGMPPGPGMRRQHDGPRNPEDSSK